MGEVKEIGTEQEETEREVIKTELLSTLTGRIFPDEDYSEEDYSEPENFDPECRELVDGAALVKYEDAIRKLVDQNNQIRDPGKTPCNLMEYFSGSDTVKRKVESAVISIKKIDGVLYGCTTLKLRESLDEKEWSELKEYMEGQYSDGWGEHIGRREIPIDGGTLYLQFWQYYDFHFFHKEEICVGEALEEDRRLPRLRLQGYEGNIFSILVKVRQLLVQNGQEQEAEELFDRIGESVSYGQALGILGEYVEMEQDLLVQGFRSREQGEKKDRRNEECR